MKVALTAMMIMICLMPSMGVRADSGSDVRYDGFEELPIREYYLPNSSILIGCWCLTPVYGNGGGESINFYQDGSFARFYPGGTDPRISQNGTWQVSNDELIVEIASQTVNEGGHIVNDGGGAWIEGGQTREQDIVPPIICEYHVFELLLYIDNSEDEDGFSSGEAESGRFTMEFQDEQYWRISDVPLDLWE